jgi:hypothetical protein
MTEPYVTYENVQDAMNKLRAAGKSPTSTAIRNLLGNHGSLSSILKFINQIKEVEEINDINSLKNYDKLNNFFNSCLSELVEERVKRYKQGLVDLQDEIAELILILEEKNIYINELISNNNELKNANLNLINQNNLLNDQINQNNVFLENNKDEIRRLNAELYHNQSIENKVLSILADCSQKQITDKKDD